MSIENLSINEILVSPEFKRFVKIKTEMMNKRYKKTSKLLKGLPLNENSLLLEYLEHKLKIKK